MHKSFIHLSLCSVVLLSVACSRKTIPQRQGTIEGNTTNVKVEDVPGDGKSIDTATVVVAPVKKAVAITTPKFITVNDAVAKKAVDGRLYYDLEGKRYWKNYKTGKYYLYNKTMNGNPDYKPNN